nr:unnamed protein product [Gossypium raimondii]
MRLDIDVQKLENDKLKKEKNKAEEELGNQNTDYKKLCLSLEKISEQWQAEIREEKDKADRWEQKFQEMHRQNKALEKSLSESQKEKCELKDRVVVLEGCLRQYRN